LCPWNTRRELYQKVGNFVGSVSSPILANIYLHELDCYVESLISAFNQGEERHRNAEYSSTHSTITWLNKKIDQERAPDTRATLLDRKKALQRRMLEIPGADQHDPEYRRLGYYRYADDFVLSVIGTKREAEEIYRKIEAFLAEELKLKTSQAKSGIKHNSEVIRFLGYDITIRNSEKTVRGKRLGQHFKRRTMKSRVTLSAPFHNSCHGYQSWHSVNKRGNRKLTCFSFLKWST
jgi:RNA-directed DNA polymerase